MTWHIGEFWLIMLVIHIKNGNKNHVLWSNMKYNPQSAKWTNTTIFRSLLFHWLQDYQTKMATVLCSSRFWIDDKFVTYFVKRLHPTNVHMGTGSHIIYGTVFRLKGQQWHTPWTVESVKRSIFARSCTELWVKRACTKLRNLVARDISGAPGTIRLQAINAPSQGGLANIDSL